MNDISFSRLNTLSAASNGVICLVGLQASTASNWAIVRVYGADATTFLHNQLTHDVALLPDDTARLAAWCNAKGRMQASFVLVRETKKDGYDSYLLLCRKDVLGLFIQKIKMFVLRSKVLIEDVSSSMAAYGLLGETTHNFWNIHGGSFPMSPWTCLQVPERESDRHLIGLYPGASGPGQRVVSRILCLQDSGLPAPAGKALDIACWEWAEIASGVATIEEACAGQFVPQMINFESVGGVSFKKGCYPGQEVVARSQFRGAIKRRGYIAVTHDPESIIHAGKEVWYTADPYSAFDDNVSEPCGIIAQAAHQGSDCVLFASLQIHIADAALAGSGSLHVQGATGRVSIKLVPRPYPLIDV